MHIYCKTYCKYTANTYSRKITLISKNKIRGKSRFSICLTKRSFIDDIEYDLESALEVYIQFFTD